MPIELTEGAIFLTNIPSDPTGKLRPVLALRKLPKFNDFLVCAITTQLHQVVENFDIIISEDDEHFLYSGLQKTSLIRLGTLSRLLRGEDVSIIGFIHPNIHRQLLHNLSSHLVNY
jgi:mRNA interferase MazF